MLPKWHKYLVIFLMAFAVGALLYSVGRINGYDAGKNTVRDSVLKATDRRIIERAPEVKQKVQEAVHFQQATAAKIDTFHKHVVIIDSTHVSVDGGPPQTDVPVSLVIPPLQLCETMLTHDTAAITVLQAQLHDMKDSRDMWQGKYEDEHPHFGFKTGVIIGSAALYVATHPKQVVKAAKWLIGVF